MKDTPSAELAQLLAQPYTADYLRELADYPGWNSNPQLGWALAGEDRTGRSTVYKMLDVLVRAGVLEAIAVAHNNNSLRCVLVDRSALLDLLAGA
jgi:hypothetical protein